LGFNGANNSPQQNYNVQHFGFRPVAGPFPGFTDHNHIDAAPKLILNTTATKASEGALFTSNFFPAGSFQAHLNKAKEASVASNSVTERDVDKSTTTEALPTKAALKSSTSGFRIQTEPEDTNPTHLQSYFKFSTPVGLYGNRDVYNVYTSTPPSPPTQQSHQYSVNYGSPNPTITSNGVTHHLGNGFFGMFMESYFLVFGMGMVKQFSHFAP